MVPRTAHAAGRYQSPTIEDFNDFREFLSRFKPFFEGDGRHQVWIAAPDQRQQIVYDRHEILYVYGDLKKTEDILVEAGFERSTIRISAPHTHHYNASFDSALADLMNWWDWKYSPLEPGDDD